MKTDKTTTPWTWRDTVGCFLVPLVSASLGSWFITLWTTPHLFYSVHNSVSFGEAFAVSFGTLLGLFLVFRLTLFQCSTQCSERWAVRLRLPAVLVLIGVFFVLGLLILAIRTSFFASLPELPGLSLSDLWNYDYIVFLPLVVAAGLILAYLITFALCFALFGNWRLAGDDFGALIPYSRTRQFTGAVLLLLLAMIPWSAVGEFWQRGSDRALCIMNIRNTQVAMRSWSGMNGYGADETVETFSKHLFVGPGLFVGSEPVCPAGGTYTWVEGRTPKIGELMLRCSCEGHEPPDYADW